MNKIYSFDTSYTIDSNGCWLWNLCKDSIGYGLWKFNYKYWKAHRYSWTINKGPIPVGIKVCHKCDVRHCVNPEHLFLGTQQDNVNDMIAKGRKPIQKGDTAANRKLTSSEVAFIRANLKQHGDGRRLAKQFGVTPSQISGIKNGKSWS